MISKLEKTVERLIKESHNNHPPQAFTEVSDQFKKSEIKLRKSKIKA